MNKFNPMSLLPNGLTALELASWLRLNAKEQFTDQRKEFFDPKEIQEYEHESSQNGREMNRLNDTLKLVRSLVTKGTEEAVTITIPATSGTKVLDAQRRQNDDMIESGYELAKVEIFGIPSEETITMEFFDVEGNYIAERSRSLSAKEKYDIFGHFNPNQRSSNLSFEANGDIADTESGEVLNTGTDN